MRAELDALRHELAERLTQDPHKVRHILPTENVPRSSYLLFFCTGGQFAHADP